MGPCAKRRVTCSIELPSGEIFIGTNACANPQPVCPRAPGEDYAKCQTICRQGGHAEIEALRLAREFTDDLGGAKAELCGHYWICEPCGAALREAGVASVTIHYER